jgi:nicotinamide-nucleotide amidase
MYIEILSIGDELLKGVVVNTNAAFLSKSLCENGYLISRQSVFSDDPIVLDKELRAALSRSCILIATGGLGTTLDDHTTKIAAMLFNSEYAYNEELATHLKKRFGNLKGIDAQAMLPKKAKLLPNSVGLAPGLVFEAENKLLILLPGVPLEMEVMFTEQVLPLLDKKVPVKAKSEERQLHFCMLNEATLDQIIRESMQHFSDVEVGIYPRFGSVSLNLRSKNRKQLDEWDALLSKRLGLYLFSRTTNKIEEALHSWFIKHRKRLSLAESCTGGALSAELVKVAGASDYFLGAFLTYSDALKVGMLGVSEKTLKAFGAVSAETVREMCMGVFQKSDADFAVAVSGIAGPSGGTPQKPVGTVWAAIAERGKAPDVGKFHIAGPRLKVIQATVQYLLGALWRKVEHGISAFSS